MSVRRSSLTAGIAVLASVALGAPAQAATVKVKNGVATLTATYGEDNDVQALVTGFTSAGFSLDVTDAGAPLTPGAGCTPTATGASCTDVTSLIVWARDGDDRVFLRDELGFRYAEFYGESGDDQLTVSSHIGFSPLLDGGSGHDTLTANMNSGSDVPVLHGRGGDDVLNLFQVDGGEAYGGSGNDRITSHSMYGTPLVLDGQGGDDTYTLLRSRVAAIVPGTGIDTLDESGLSPFSLSLTIDLTTCGGCVEVVIGGPRSDFIAGSAKGERLEGGTGNDSIDGGAGKDSVSGQDGDDVISAVDGYRDTISCGDGFDSVTADALDIVASDCEDVVRS